MQLGIGALVVFGILSFAAAAQAQCCFTNAQWEN